MSRFNQEYTSSRATSRPFTNSPGLSLNASPVLTVSFQNVFSSVIFLLPLKFYSGITILTVTHTTSERISLSLLYTNSNFYTAIKIHLLWNIEL